VQAVVKPQALQVVLVAMAVMVFQEVEAVGVRAQVLLRKQVETVAVV
jgi:hypothetical protein